MVLVETLRLAASQLAYLLQISPARTAMIVIAVFVIDTLKPVGISTGGFYVAAVLSAVPIRNPRAVYYTALICSLLILASWITSLGGGAFEWWKVLVNRLLDMGIVWAAAGMADSWNRLQDRRLKQTQESRLLHQATMLSASQLSFRQALENSLQTLCEILGCPAGHVYLRDSAGRYLLSSDIWWTSEDERFDLVRAAARGLRFGPGEGVPGKIWEAGESIAVPDVAASPDYDWLAEPELLGVRGAFALPITVGGETAAVMEFFSEQPIAGEFDFMPLARNVGEQLGRLFERRRADENLRRSEERLRLALQGGGMGIWERHLETDRVVWSPELERIHGLEPGTFEGTYEAVQQRWHPEDRERVMEATRCATEEGRDFRVEYRIIRPDGSVRWLEGRGAFHADADGHLRRMVGVSIDITERKDAEVRNALLAAIVQSSDDAILAKSLDGTVLNWNGGAERIYGYTADEMVGRSVDLLVPEDHWDDTHSILERIARGERIDHYETQRRRKDGRTITISLTLSPIVDSRGNVVAASSVARDVTEKRRAEQEMKEAREKAETANRLRSRFVANMSHELRTPMNSVLGMLQLTLGSDIPAEARRWLTTAKASADSLLLLLNDLLDYSKIEAGKLEIHPEPFRLRELLDETVRAHSIKAFEKGVQLLLDVEPDVPERAVGDAGRLRQVLTNLIANAVKFTETGEVVVSATLEAAQPHAATVRFAVADTGIGIAPDEQKRIFEPFIQSEAAMVRQHGGAGLGLAIAVELVRRMGGEIQLESAMGKGSRFWFSLPFHVADDAASGARPGQDPALLEGVRVLVVDDNEASRGLLVKLLSRWTGTLPEAAIDLDHAVGKLQRAEDEQRAFRLVVADAAGAEGGALVHRITDAVTQSPAVVLVRSPGHGGRDDWNERPQTCLEKPVAPARLIEAMQRALGIDTPDADEHCASPHALPAERSLAVLVVEDTPANQEVAASVLRRRGHTVVIAANGREALDVLAGRQFDVVLMDVTMPVMDGYEATAAIRKDESRQGRHVPIIAMTAHATRDDREKCAAAGMDAYLPKPIDVATLVELVEAIAERRAERPGSARPRRSAARSRETDGAAAGHPPRARGGRSPASQGSPSEEPVIDLGGALRRLGGDTVLLRKIIDLFDEDSPSLMQTIRQAVTDGDPASLQRAAHSLKGLAANFGAQAAVRSALRLEEMGKSGALADAEDAIAELQHALERLDRALVGHRSATDAKTVSPST